MPKKCWICHRTDEESNQDFMQIIRDTYEESKIKSILMHYGNEYEKYVDRIDEEGQIALADDTIVYPHIYPKFGIKKGDNVFIEEDSNLFAHTHLGLSGVDIYVCRVCSAILKYYSSLPK